MRYMLLIHQDEKAMQATRKEDGLKVMSAYEAFTQAMKEARVFLAGDRLQPSATATVVRVKDGKSQVLNGPYAEIREQLGGFYMIEAADLDAAIGWAARCPGAAFGAIEVRPIHEM